MTRRSIPASLLLSAMLLVPVATPAAAHESHSQTTQHSDGATATRVITVSCFRGPWEGVIWDRPNPIFIDSLVDAGYTFPQAHAIAERVCRDQTGVGAPETMRAAMENILRTSPPGR